MLCSFISHCTPQRRGSQLFTSGIGSCSNFSNTEHLHGLSLLLQGRPAPSPCLFRRHSHWPVPTDTSCTVLLDLVFLYSPVSHSSRGALPVGSGRPLASLSFLELRLLHSRSFQNSMTLQAYAFLATGLESASSSRNPGFVLFCLAFCSTISETST